MRTKTTVSHYDAEALSRLEAKLAIEAIKLSSHKTKIDKSIDTKFSLTDYVLDITIPPILHQVSYELRTIIWYYMVS